MAKEKLFQVGVKALIVNEEGRVLVFRADTAHEHVGDVEPYWDLAGGRIKEGQTVEQALRCEIDEETGIKQVKSIEFFTAVISNHEIPLSDGSSTGLVLMIYRVKLPKNSVIKLSQEHDLFEWVDNTTAAKRLANKYPPEFTQKLL